MAGFSSPERLPVPGNWSGLKSWRFKLALASWLLLAAVFTLVLPQPVAKGAGISGWGGVQGPYFVTNPTVVSRPNSNQTIILGTIENDDPSVSGVFAFTSSGGGFSGPIRLNPTTSDQSRVGSVRAAFDKSGNLHVVWSTQIRNSGAFQVFYQKYDANLTPISSTLRNFNNSYYGGGVQPYDPDIATSLIPGGTDNIYVTFDLYPYGVDVWESTDGGANWGNKYTAINSEYTKAVPRIAVQSNGDIHVAFTPSGTRMIIASRISGQWRQQTISTPTSNVVLKSIAVGNNNRAYVAWISGRNSVIPPDSISLVRWDSSSNTWGSTVNNATNESGGSGYDVIKNVGIAAGQDDTVVIAYPVFRANGGGVSVRYSVSGDQGSTWNTGVLGNLSSSLPTGQTADVYFDGQNRFHFVTAFSGEGAYYSVTTGGGTFTPPLNVPVTKVNTFSSATTADNSGSFDVSWTRVDKPVTPDEKIQYVVEYRDATANGPWQPFRRTLSTSATFHNGVPGRTYEFRVYGINTNGVTNKTETAHNTADAAITVSNSTTQSTNYFHIISPTRFFSSVGSTGLTANTPRSIPFNGITAPNGTIPVPQGATGVIMNVTAVNTAAPGFLTAYATANPPATASVNWAQTGAQVGNLVFTPIAPGGVIYFVSSTNTDFIIDILGYTDGNTSGAGFFTAVTPQPIYDSRDAGALSFGKQAPFINGETRNIKVTDANGVPATGVQAVVVNVTAARTTNGGNIALYPGPSSAAYPGNATVNFVTNPKGATTTGNFTIAAVGSDGTINIRANFANGTGQADVIISIVGYLDATTTGGTYKPIVAERVYDSRVLFGANLDGPVASNTTRAITVDGLVRNGAKAVILNVTATDITTGGYVSLFPGGTPFKNNTTVNYSLARDNTTIKTVGNFTIVPINQITSATNLINLTAGGNNPPNVIIDIVGFIY